jgi:hypothetical protein
MSSFCYLIYHQRDVTEAGRQPLDQEPARIQILGLADDPEARLFLLGSAAFDLIAVQIFCPLFPGSEAAVVQVEAAGFSAVEQIVDTPAADSISSSYTCNFRADCHMAQTTYINRRTK